MERRRSQQQKFKQQQRFCVSQQDLSDALARMKPTRSNDDQRTVISASSSIERLTNLSVTQLIKEFEARTNATPYASAQDLLPMINGEQSNVSHMSLGTVQIKDMSYDNDITNKNVCSSISRSINDDNQMVLVDFHHQLLFDDKKEQEKKTAERRQKKKNCHHSQAEDFLPDPSNDTSNMVTRSTDLDAAAAAALTPQQQNTIQFEQLLSKEAELNNALADLMSISNDTHRSISLNSSPRSLTLHQPHSQRVSTPKIKTNGISASIDLLNNLLESLDADQNPIKPINVFRLMVSDNVCANCQQLFATNEQIVNAAGQLWHTHCFVCTQCFQSFENGIYFEHEGRKYCERDYQMLFAPCCVECQQPIIGRVIRALHKCFHPDCFRCQLCQKSLIDAGFLKYQGRALCRDCHAKEKGKDTTVVKQICSTCHQLMDGKYLKYKGEFYHPYHLRCTSCYTELNESSREARGLLYCQTCHNQLDLPICSACRCVIDDRVISALGKKWHVEHFCCARCARPFYGNQHYEHQGLAYCESDYRLLFGPTCFICNQTITGTAFTACNKKYCAEHFGCSLCEKKFHEKSKFFDVDSTPVCKHCYGKFPSEKRKSLQQQKPKTLKQTSV